MDVDGTTLNYVSHGSGEPVVLIHCSSSSLGQWRGLWELLQGDYQVLALDLLGYGGTGPWTGETEELLAEEAKLVHALADQFDNGFHMVGHSYGGLIALRIALENPDLLKSLVLIEPMTSWLLDTEEDAAAYAEILSVAHDYWRRFDEGDILSAAKNYMEYWSGEGTWLNFDEKLRDYVVATTAKTYDEFTNILNRESQTAPLETITAPCLLIRGSDTRNPSRRNVEIISAAMPGARQKIIDGAGHLSPLTHPKAVNRVIQEFLNGLE